jgi:hypothetical protein
MHARHGHGRVRVDLWKAWVVKHIYLVYAEILWILKKQNVIKTLRPT